MRFCVLFELHERQGALNQWLLLFEFLIVLADSISVFFKVNNLGFMSDATNVFYMTKN